MPSRAQRRSASTANSVVGGLGLAVGGKRVVGDEGEREVVEQDWATQAGRGGDRDDPRVAGGAQRVGETGGQREVTEVVGGEVQLVAAGGEGALGDRHHPGVVDEDVERSVPAVDERGHRGRVRQLKGANVDGAVAGALADLRGGGLAGGRVSCGEGDRGASSAPGRARSLSRCPKRRR